MNPGEEQDRLREWYLARLRKRALADASESSSWTPATLILADRAKLESLIAARSEDEANRSVVPPQGTTPDPKMASAAGTLLCIGGVFATVYFLAHRLFIEAGGFLALIISATIVLVRMYSRARQEQQEMLKYLQQAVQKSSAPVKRIEELSIDQLLARLLDHITRLEERQNLIADYAQDVICTLDESLKLCSISPGCHQAWERSAGEIAGKNIADILVPDDGKPIAEAFAQGKAKGGEFYVEGHLTGRSGRVIDTRWCVEWSNSESSYFAAIQDISAQKEIERVKNEFVAVVSHDLRSPITNVQWTLKLIEEGLYGHLNETGHKRLREANHTVDFMLDLIADLLDIHRMETSTPRLSYDTVSYQDLADESIRAVESLADSKHMELVRTIASGTCEVDRVRIKRVLINLLANAIKFSPAKTPIEIKIDETRTYTEIVIADHGKGIAPELLDRLFDRFTSVADPSARRDGSGLGLFASKAIVESHGGEIRVESEVDRGTKFFITLPKRAANDSHATAAPPPP